MNCPECGKPMAVRAGVGGPVCINFKCPLRGLDPDLVKQHGRPS